MPTEYFNELEAGAEFTFSTAQGFKFVARQDLKNSIKIYPPKRFNRLIDKESLVAEATAEFIGMWMLERYPRLNGFAGLDCLRFDFCGEE